MGKRGVPELLLLEGRATDERDAAPNEGMEKFEARALDQRYVAEVECQSPAGGENALLDLRQLGDPCADQMPLKTECDGVGV